MSLILGYATPLNAIIMSDGRAMRVGEDHSYSEHCDKTLKINDNIIIGFAGIMENIDMFLSCILSNMGEDRKQYLINDFLYMVDYVMQDEETKSNLESSFIIIGRDSKNNMIASTAGHLTNYKIESGIVAEPKFLSIGGTIDRSIINKICMSHIGKISISPIKTMEKIIKDVGNIDPAVNGNTFYSFI